MTEQEQKAVSDIAARITGETIQLPIYPAGRANRHKPETGTFRSMTLDEVKALGSGQWVWFHGMQGYAVQVRINGSVKRWKREPDRVSVPIKYGLRECNRLEDARDLRALLVRLDKGHEH